ncbi:hypothetical protein CSUI_005362 [Cystoisospora suis]|uniref:J domain-containing protein n=1 Tax=Cystoisospora suis TaxID=483139 RepID=A0A2C6KVH6_9APIC|nr:hypothetical protein CSUI_005362 [Cystoisospora suis]
MEKSLVDGGGGHGETGVSTKVDTVSSSKQTISDLPVDSSTVSSPAGTGLSPGSFSPSSSSFLQEKETREKDSERRFHAVPRLRQTETAAEGWGDRETDEDSLLFVSPSPLQTHRSSPSRTTSIPETVSGGDFGAERTTTGGGGGEEEVVDRHRRFHLQQPRHTSGRSRGGEEREGKSNKNTHDRRTSHGNSTMKNYYQVLGVRTDAPPDEIRRVYYALCKIYHPDKSSCSARGGTAVGGEEEENRLSPSHTSQYFHAERLCAIQQAYAVLSDEVKRLHYDLRIGIFKGQDKWRKLTEVYQIQRKRAARDLENMVTE